MAARKISLSEVHLNQDAFDAVAAVMKSGNLREGAKTREFEKAFADKVGVPHAVAVSSGTAALHVTYLALLQPGDEVLVPAFTFVATASMIVMAGAKPVFCDIHPKTWTLDPRDAAHKITDKTRAIAGVHLFGNACDIESLRKIAAGRNIRLIWDAAQALGTRYQGKDVAQLEDAVCFSFYPTKNMSTGEGGMITTSNEDLAKRMRLIKAHGQPGKYIHELVGLNYRMSEMEAVIGMSQLKELDFFLSRRKELAAQYRAAFEALDEIEIQEITLNSDHSFNYACIALRSEKISASRDEFAAALASQGIPTAVHYPKPLHFQPCFENIRTSSLPVSEKLSERILALPMHPYLQEDDITFITSAIKKVIKQFSQAKVSLTIG